REQTLGSMRKELLSAIKLACHEFGANEESFSRLKGFFADARGPSEKLPKTPQSLFITFTFGR
ncbi:hypothetical protein, partial [Pseudomonas savastanoi]